MWSHHHFGVHPDVAAIATEMDQSGRRHGARSDLVGEWKGEVKDRCTIHVNGVQRGVGALHLERGILRDEENMWDVAAMFLIQVPPLLGQNHGLDRKSTRLNS